MATRYFAAVSPHKPENLEGWWIIECFEDGTAWNHLRKGGHTVLSNSMKWLEIYEKNVEKGVCVELTDSRARTALRGSWASWARFREIVNSRAAGGAIAAPVAAYGDHW